MSKKQEDDLFSVKNEDAIKEVVKEKVSKIKEPEEQKDSLVNKTGFTHTVHEIEDIMRKDFDEFIAKHKLKPELAGICKVIAIQYGDRLAEHFSQVYKMKNFVKAH